MVAAGIVLSATMSLHAQAALNGETRLAMNIGGRTLERVKDGHAEWVYQWPAIYFESRFKGERVRLMFDDPSNNFNVLIDGRELMLLKRPGETTVALDHLGAGEHTVRLEKRSETREEAGAFVGFFVPAAADALPAQVSARKIEFIGDSLTVGFGNTSAFGTCSKEELFETTDAQESFAPLTAKHFNAEYRVEAFSGLGLIRNAGGTLYPQYSLRRLWPRVLFDDTQDVAAAWGPHVMVIGIGGNDFTGDLHGNERWKTQAEMAADYEDSYVAFVKQLRRENADALIVLMWTRDKSADYTRSAERVYARLVADGVNRLDKAVLPKMERTGCQNHPNIHDDAAVAKLFEALIDAHSDAWQGN